MDGDTSAYGGVMSHVDMWDQPRRDDDRTLINEHR
jgi:hypothetical protein